MVKSKILEKVREWEFTKMSHDEVKEFFGPMKSILAPQQILIAEVDGKPVGLRTSL